MAIDELWQAALDDAGVEASDAVYFVRPGVESANGVRGKCWPRNDEIVGTADRTDLGDDFDRANSPPTRSLRRIAIWIDGRTAEGTAAVLRHELEHSRQFEWGRSLLNLYGEALHLLQVHVGGLPKSNELYNKIPMEVDANRAASIFVRKLFGSARIDALVAADDPDVALFRADDPPGPIGHELRIRMKAFIDVDGPRYAQEFVSRQRPDGLC